MTASKTMIDLAPFSRVRAELIPSGLFRADAGPIVLGRGPGRLDVMGGIADYSGSLVCEMPLAIAAGAAVQSRHEGLFICRSLQTQTVASCSAVSLLGPDPLAVRSLFEADATWARYVAGCVWWLAQFDVVPDPSAAGNRLGRLIGAKLAKGLTVLLYSDVPLGGGVSSSAAIEVAVMSALATLLDVTLTPLQLAAACQAVENRVVGAPCGVMDQVTSCMGKEDSMLEILCQPGRDGLPAQVKGELRVPPGFAFAGIHSGVRHEVAGDPYTDTRVASFIGQKIISSHRTPDPSRGWLANLNPQRYETEFRTLVPERITGKAFLDAYGATNDPVTMVVPERSYHARSATDHHVREMARVTEFVKLLKDTDAQTLDARMTRAGELMYASHKSYSECALMGHPMTDKLVDAVRGLGLEHGFFGAKITGGGCGGTVAVLLRDTPESWHLLQQMRTHYETQNSRKTLFFKGTSPGAATTGTITLAPEDVLR